MVPKHTRQTGAKPGERKHKIKKSAVADAETDPFAYRTPAQVAKGGIGVAPFVFGYYDGQDLRIFWGDDCAKQFLAFVKKRNEIIYLHNFGKFDFWQMLKDADPEGWHSAVMVGSRLVSIRYYECEFRDSYALIPKPLASWEKDIIDYRKFLKHRREANKAEIIRYLKVDLRGLKSMTDEFTERYGRSLTLASATVKIMEKDFGVKVPKLTERDDRWFRNFYFAGRVQFWGLGRHMGNYSIYDINSAFPWAMTKMHGFSSKWRDGEGRGPKKNRQNFLYLVECESEGALPFRMENKSVEFPTGPGRFYITGWELLTAERLGLLSDLKVIWHWRPRRLQTFKAYVLHFYRMKARAKTKADRYFAKLVLNAYYGRTGINPRNFREVAIRPWRKLPLGKDGKPDQTWQVAHDDRELGVTVYERPSPVLADKFSNVTIAASITGCVRAFLLEAIAKTRPIYCDTDSLITKKSPHPVGTGLGEWKKEMACDVVWIGGKKLYVAHDRKFPWRSRAPKKKKDWVHVKGLGWSRREAFKTAAKGVRLSVEDLIAVCEGRTRTGKFMAPSYSLFRGASYTTRTIRRADKRK